MIKVISVRFRSAGKVYFFDPLEFQIEKGEHVIVETARGIEYGLVVGGIREVEDEKVIQPLKPVIRIATEEDNLREEENQKKKDEAFEICLEKIKKHNLDMKLVDAEYTFDNNKVLFYFTADGRIDFRELVKDLAAIFKTRIELRQIGVRDEIKIMGGIGVCGRVLCCHSYLSEFVPVSIKMAKEQNLSLNPTKISGVCGRLMCCLKNEEEIYGELNKKLPNTGDYVTTDDGLHGEVHSVNVLRQLVRVIVDTGDEREIKEYHTDQLRFKKKYHRENEALTEEEMRELKQLEQEESDDKVEKAERQQERQNRERQERNNRKEQNKNGNDNNRRNVKGGNSEADSREQKEDRRERKNFRNDGKSRNDGNNRNDRNNRNDGVNHVDASNRNENNRNNHNLKEHSVHNERNEQGDGKENQSGEKKENKGGNAGKRFHNRRNRNGKAKSNENKSE